MACVHIRSIALRNLHIARVYRRTRRPGGPGTLNSIFASQFKCNTRVKLRVFVPKVLKSKCLRCYTTLRIVCLHEAQTTFIVFYGTLRSKQFQLKIKLLVVSGILLKNSNAVLAKSAMLMVD